MASIPQIENRIRSDLLRLDQATTEAEAQEAFQALKTHLEELLNSARTLRDEFFKQRNTLARQANKIADLELDQLAQPNPAPPKTYPSPDFTLPETLTVTTNPDFFFIPIQSGRVNIRHIAFLDPHTNTLYLSGGIVRQLSPQDVRKLNFHLQHFQP
ncbi:MAG: hypothetical protein D6765_17590 [Bacteroidetes bacterium]|nr:MAG: hypothetical protein D6765_17590 [Bacteroidota bacterium]